MDATRRRDPPRRKGLWRRQEEHGDPLVAIVREAEIKRLREIALHDLDLLLPKLFGPLRQVRDAVRVGHELSTEVRMLREESAIQRQQGRRPEAVLHVAPDLQSVEGDHDEELLESHGWPH